jgi:hypothetical protein
MSKKPLRPKEVVARVRAHWARQHRAWFDEGGSWPLTVSLVPPTERQFLAAAAQIRAWVQAWGDWREEGQVLWETRAWPKAGEQRLPIALQFTAPDQVARLLGEHARWARARARREQWLERWPQLSEAPAGAGAEDDDALFGLGSADADEDQVDPGFNQEAGEAQAAESVELLTAQPSGLGRYFKELADYDAADFERLTSVLDWFLANPTSGLYIRELPIMGVDTKWLQDRPRLVVRLLARLKGVALPTDLHEACGLRRPPTTVWLKVLCPQLREETGGLTSIEAPLAEISQLKLRPRAVLVLENQTTGWALPDVPGTVAFIKLGHAVSVLADVPWLQGVPVVYWGDIDTHGLVIVARARRALGTVRSVLMDEETIQRYRLLCVREPKPHASIDFEEWTQDERHVFAALRSNAWGENVRLEQERLPWPEAWTKVQAALAEATAVEPWVA